MTLLLHGLRIEWGLTIRHDFICRTLGLSVKYVLNEIESYLGKLISLAFHNFPNFILSFYGKLVVETQDQISVET